ncbi:hypothetical protein MBLNU230_g0674t1 [Neophaeotheca triangularis]
MANWTSRKLKQYHQFKNREDSFLSKTVVSRMKIIGLLAKWLLILLLGLLVAWLLSRYVAVPFLVFLNPSLDSLFYDLAIYGRYPEQTYISFPLSSPRSSVVKWDESCNDGLVLLDLHGDYVKNEGPMIMDPKGELVWLTDAYGLATNLQVQRYKGEGFLTFWAGEKSSSTFGGGKYYMLNSTYHLVHKVEAVGNWYKGDLHEFTITENDTALMTIYDPKKLDLKDTPMDWVKDGLIVDGLIQEVDIATGELLFEWRASDHLAEISDISYGGYVEGTTTGVDYFHLNSVDKDSDGNYLVSARFVHTILLIDAETGNVTWSLGGDATDFEDLSDGAASDFMWQHDVRWVSEADGIMSLFDNGVAYGEHWTDSPYSTGRVIKVDVEARTVELLHSYRSLGSIRAKSQGSMQVLPAPEQEERDGSLDRVFIGWGSSAAFTEYTIDGNLLCETHFSASLFYKQEPAMSYRAIKFSEWHGRPYWPPAATILGDEVFVSWNGATDVISWTLQGTRAQDAETTADEHFEDLTTVDKRGFETRFQLPKNHGIYNGLRIAAVEEDGTIVRHSTLITTVPAARRKFLAWVAAILLIALAGLAGVYRDQLRGLAVHLFCRRKDWKDETEYHHLAAEEDIPLHEPR